MMRTMTWLEVSSWYLPLLSFRVSLNAVKRLAYRSPASLVACLVWNLICRPDLAPAFTLPSGSAATNLNAVAFGVKVVDQMLGSVSAFRSWGTSFGSIVV